MSVRHLLLALVLAIAACGQVPQTLPNATHLGSSRLASLNTWYVDGVHGRDQNDCKSPQSACRHIRQAMTLSGPGDSIMVAPAVYLENLRMPHSLNIVGAGAATTILDGRQFGQTIISGHATSIVNISGVTLRNGGAGIDGGAIYNCTSTLTVTDSILTGNHVRGSTNFYGYGGAIYNCPTAHLTIVNSTIRDNTAEAGGAICNGGILTIINSTFNGNMARRYRGGGIFNYGTLIITNSTFAGNRAPNGIGGAIDNGQLFGSPGTVVISSSTLTLNTAGDQKGGGINNLTGGSVTLRNTIVSRNAGNNCSGIISSAGYNLSSDGTCDLQSTGDLNNTNPRLSQLLDNGGPTKTIVLLPGSPAIDAGNPNGCTDAQGQLLTTDQRGEQRPDGEDSGGCDMGAYEREGD